MQFSITTLLLLFLPTIVAGEKDLTGLPSQTSYAELLMELAKIYNPASCGEYSTDLTSSTVNNLVSVCTDIACNGQKVKVYGQGNGLDVKFPIIEKNYTAIDLERVQMCGRTGGCFNIYYVGSGLPTAAACDAFAKRSDGAPETNCTSCHICDREFSIKMTIDCANVNSEYTTLTCVTPFTSNSSVMGVTGTTGGGGTSDASQWREAYGMIIGALMSAFALWL